MFSADLMRLLFASLKTEQTTKWILKQEKCNIREHIGSADVLIPLSDLGVDQVQITPVLHQAGKLGGKYEGIPLTACLAQFQI